MWKRAAGAVLLAGTLLAGCAQTGAKENAKPQASATQAVMVNLSAKDLLAQVKGGTKPYILDVRTPEEYAAGHIDGAKLAPLQTLEKEIAAIPKNQEIALICRSGNRSVQAAQIMAELGYTKLINVTGGMTEWEKLGGPVVK
jgi:rhodanese-related sulfurtransferase